MKKPWYKSLTIWGLIATLAGLALAGIGQGKPLFEVLADPKVQGTLGELVAALGLGGVLLGRVRKGDLTRRAPAEPATACPACGQDVTGVQSEDR
jgi:hypothetical protein